MGFLPQMRDAQYAAVTTQGARPGTSHAVDGLCHMSYIMFVRVTAVCRAVTRSGAGFAVNSDHGKGCDIHPTQKQNCGYRLGNSALAKVYGQSIAWESPSYAGIVSLTAGGVVLWPGC